MGASFMGMPNSKSYLDRLKIVQNNLNDQEKHIKENYGKFGFTKVASTGFCKSNVIEDLSSNATLAIPVEEEVPSIGNVNGYNVVNSLPFNDFAKNGVSYAYPQDPSTYYSSTASNTVETDRADGKRTFYRWTSRNIFKFTSSYYGYDRCIFKIPLIELANGVVIDRSNGIPHENTLSSYPYPEEIIMTSQNSEKNFIHFINVQYTDSHYGHYNGKNYNVMIAKDRYRYGVINDTSNEFRTYLSIYTNDINTDLAYVKNGYLYLPVPDEVYGEELLDTLWDCRVIWRHDAPDRDVSITASIEQTTVSNSYNDFDIYDGRIALFNTSKECNISTDRNSVENLNIQKSNIQSLFGSPLRSHTSLNIAPTFESSYTPKLSTELTWLSSGSPNQIYRISDKYYLGFYYYNASNRGTTTFISDIPNHTSQLYWGLFDSLMKSVNPVSSTTSGVNTYPCRQYSSAFSNVEKIIRVFRGDINTETGVSCFYIFTQMGIYKFTFTLSGSTLNTSFTLLKSFDFAGYMVMRISETEFLMYNNTTTYKYTIGGNIESFMSSAPYLLLGKYLYSAWTERHIS